CSISAHISADSVAVTGAAVVVVGRSAPVGPGEPGRAGPGDACPPAAPSPEPQAASTAAARSITPTPVHDPALRTADPFTSNPTASSSPRARTFSTQAGRGRPIPVIPPAPTAP